MSQPGNDERPPFRGQNHRAAPSGRRDNPDRNRQQGGPSAGGARRNDDRGGPRGNAQGGGGQREFRERDPRLPDDVYASELDPEIRRDLVSLEKSSAETVARHLMMASRILLDDPALALEHARAARRRAARIAVVREAAGVAAYYAGEWSEALNELRTARRIGGGPGLLAMMADCERGLGRPERAIELARSEEARQLTGEQATELRIVIAGARMDLEQFDAAVVTLQTPELDPEKLGPVSARLFYVYAEALLGAGRTDEAVKWFLHSASADDEETDAEERAAELSPQHEE